jgi:hypothetical protein
MWAPIVLGVLAGAARMACLVTASWMVRLGERERCRSAVALLAASGPGTALLDRRSDGSLLVVGPGVGGGVRGGARGGEGARA